MPDMVKPHNDPYALVGENWPLESESAYHAAKILAEDSSTLTTTQAESASDAESKMTGESGQAADAVSGRYGSAASHLREQAITYTTIGAWMSDAEGKVGKAKNNIASLVAVGTSEIRDALNSELSGTPATPSSSELIAKYQGEIKYVAGTLTTDLDAIGHSLAGDPGASRTPSYTSVSTKPTAERPDPHVSAASYTGDHHAPAVEPHQLPEMPRATSTPSAESSSAPGTPSSPASPHSTNPTLAGLISGSAPSGSSTAPSGTGSSSAHDTPAGQGAQAHHASEQHQPTEHAKSAGLPHIPSVPLPDLPAAASAITTAVTSAASGSQLPASTAPTSPLAPASTGVTPGTSGTSPMPAGGLAPIGGLTPTPTVQAPPVALGTPPPPAPGVQTPSTPQSPAPAPRAPVVDAAWLQKTYGLAPGLEPQKPESPITPALFIAALPEEEAHLHKVLASLRHQFDASGWSQPLAVASIKRGLETRTVYVTSDALSIHPAGILLPSGVIPLDEMAGVSSTSVLSGSLMVTDKLAALIPRGWEIEAVLSTVPSDENHQTAEQFEELVAAGELLECKVTRGRDDVEIDEALSIFACAAIGSAGCSDLEVESARIRAARWVGVRPVGYIDVLSRWYLADAAESMSLGNWADAVYSSEKYLGTRNTRSQAA